MFSDFNLVYSSQFAVGYSYINCVTILIFLNIGYAVYKVYSLHEYKKRMLVKQKAWKEYLIERKKREIINEINEKTFDLK